jgi:hypothetical protein
MRERGRRWVVERVPEVLGESREFFLGVVLNLALIVGVIVFQWSLIEIAVIYLVEIAIIHLLFLSVALFAPRPVDDRDGEAWETEPTPVQPIAHLPPVYWRNLKFVGGKAIGGGVLIWVILTSVLSSYDVSSGLPASIGFAIVSVILFQLLRVWRHFVNNQSYRKKSPADAMTFAFAPVVELFLMLVYVVAPVTVVLACIAFAFDTDLDSQLVLLIYLLPIGMIRAWIGSLDPQTDDLEINFN